MEEAVKQLQDQVGPGMYVVNQDETAQLYAEFDSEILETDALCEIIDPEETPYKSKYIARDRLNHLCNKLEANRTVASLEKKKNVLRELNWRIAALQVRLGSIAWDVEEPHNCQSELDRAIEFYFPGLKAKVEELAGDEDSIESGEGEVKQPKEDFKTLVPPDVSLPETALCANGLKCLNMMGILWAGRGHSRRSFLYLLATKSLYDQTNTLINLSEKDAAEIESIFTHNLFYLAQAYGNHGDAATSSHYCHLTLQRQLNSGLPDQNAALDWSKNCMGLADFYLGLENFRKCAEVLGAAEVILLKYFHEYPERLESVIELPPVPTAAQLVQAVAETVAPPPAGRDATLLSPSCPTVIIPAPSKPLYAVPLLPTLQEDTFNDIKSRLQDVEADHNRRCIKLDCTVLKIAYERESELALGDKKEDDVDPNVVSASAGDDIEESCPFDNLPFPTRSIPELNPNRINSFEAAREVFLRAAARLEVAKKAFPLDGFVTDHVNLLDEHSRLYHHLAIFEKDLKRRTAMQNKRLELLKHIVNDLNRNAYDALHKQISYELGEIYISLGDLLSEKYSAGQPMKKADMLKSNEYCLGGISMFAHFTDMYEKRTTSAPGAVNFRAVSFESAGTAGCIDPDESLLNSEELRPFLNAHFHMARLISKISVPPELPPTQRSHYLVAALKRYEWLVKAAPKYCTSKEISLDDIFRTEYELCKEMVELLPSRINRVHYLGASS